MSFHKHWGGSLNPLWGKTVICILHCLSFKWRPSFCGNWWGRQAVRWSGHHCCQMMALLCWVYMLSDIPSSGVTKISNFVLFKCPTMWGHCGHEQTWNSKIDCNHHSLLLKCLPHKSFVALQMKPWKNGTRSPPPQWFKFVCLLALPPVASYHWSQRIKEDLCKCHPPHADSPLFSVCLSSEKVWKITLFVVVVFVSVTQELFLLFILWGMFRSFYPQQTSLISSL